MRWLKRSLRRRPKRVSKLDRQLHLGLLQEAMGRAQDADERHARLGSAGDVAWRAR